MKCFPLAVFVVSNFMIAGRVVLADPSDRNHTNSVASESALVAGIDIAALHAQELLADEYVKRSCPTNPSDAVVWVRGALAASEKLATLSEAAPAFSESIRVSQLLAQVRRARLQDYKPLPVVMNVTPPISSGITFSGMNPTAISDAVARKAYEEKIAENNRNGQENNLQLHLLPEADEKLTSIFFRYAESLLKRTPDKAQRLTIISNLLRSTGLSESEAKWLKSFE